MRTYRYKGYDIVRTVGDWHLVHRDGAYISSHRGMADAKAAIDNILKQGE